MNLTTEPIWPVPLILLACAAMLVSIVIGYRRQVRQFSPAWRRTFYALRTGIALLLVALMFRPAIVLESEDSSSAVIYVVTDASRSMTTPDEVGGATRYEAMKKLLQEAQPLLDDFGGSVEIRHREFADQITAVDQPSETADGKMTAIGAALRAIGEEANGQKVAGILFLGDGKQAAAGDNDIDPIQSAKLLGRQQFPVYAVPFGSGDITATTLDLAASELDVSRDVFVRNVVPVRMRLKSLGAQGEKVTVRLLLEVQTPTATGSVMELQPVRMDAENKTVILHVPDKRADDDVLEFYVVPQQVGELKLAVEAVPLDNEVRRTNNRVETIIRVRQGGIRVAYFDKIRPEQKWLNSIAVSSRIQLNFMDVRTGRFRDRNEFDETWFEPGRFDAFIIGDVPAEIFGPQRLRAIRLCCDNGAGLMMTGGFENFGAGGYHRTPLAPLLPVDMSDNDQQLTDQIRMQPTDAGRTDYVMQIASPDTNRQRWAQLPPLNGGNLLRPREQSLARVLAESPDQAPLLIGQSVGNCRVLAFAGDSTWEWYLYEDWAAEAYQRFWRQVIFWITKKENDGDSAVWVNVEPRDLMPGRTAQLRFGARDSEGIPITDARYEVKITRPDGTITDVLPRRVDGQAEADFSETLESGDYWVNVIASLDSQVYGTATTRFLVNSRDPELDDPAADPALMREIAHVSGGDFLTPESFLERLRLWNDEGLPGLVLTRTQRITLWDNWFALLLLVALLTTEWVLRKKRGMV